ncbi:14017_t:CDS:1 [Acaulospora morrowiae]|uniref:14017_t:CDS:1 n=1 Tax=Acaulospora morrowiae TaxID=94023 RepID=A0A9N9DB59_9GLOM|nr:14017_t:CDS:1 [Acaulospora morrowiae]
MSFVDQHQSISCSKVTATSGGSSCNDNTHKSPKRERKNTLRILIHATKQLLTSPSTSPILFEEPGSSPSPINAESTYFSFPEYETYDYDEMNVKIDDSLDSRGEVENMVVQMVKFDEMLVNGVRVLAAI